MQMPTAVSIFRKGPGHTSYDFGEETHDIMETLLIDGDVSLDMSVYQSWMIAHRK
jgi:hypothetical protein